MARRKTEMTQIFLQSELLNDTEVVELHEGATRHDLRQACVERVGGNHPPEALFLFIEDDDNENAIEELEVIGKRPTCTVLTRRRRKQLSDGLGLRH